MEEINLISAQPTDEFSDKEIVEKVLNGDKNSYAILFERYKGFVYRRALIMLGDCEMALDVVQESFLIGYKNLERLRNPSSFASWIAGIAKNVCRNRMRDKNLKTVSLDYLNEVGIELCDSGNSHSCSTEGITLIRETIPDLPEKYREILELRYTKGYSCKKIADFLNLSLSAVKSRLFYARKRILKKLKKEGLL